MAITISGENNNDRILASDGVIDQISGINFVGLITASHINVGSNIQLGNAGIITATTFVGNVTGNVNSTSPLLLQTGGSERFRITGNNELGIAGANYGTAGQVLTSGGSGSAVTWSAIPTQVTINNNAANRIITGEGGTTLNGEANLTFSGNTLEVNNIIKLSDAGFLKFGVSNTAFVRGKDDTDGYLQLGTGGAERLRIDSSGRVLIGSNSNNTDDVGDSALQVHTRDDLHPAIRVNSASNNGYTMFGDAYTSGESQVNIGISHSSASLVLSQGCKVNISNDNAYVSSQGTYSTRPNAIRLSTDGSLSFLNTASASTTPTDNAVSLSERLRIDSSGDMGLGTSTIENFGGGHVTLEVAGSTTSQGGVFKTATSDSAGTGSSGTEMIMFTDNTKGAINVVSSDPLTFSTANAERLRITSGGNALFGGTAVSQTNRQLALGSNAEANFAIETHNNATSESSNIRFYKSRGTAASPTAVEDNHFISQLIFYGHDGTDYANTVGYMRVLVDGTVAGNQVPGQIQFGVNDGSTATTAMTIHKTGSVLFSGLTDKNDPRNAEGIAIKSASGISFQNYGANGSHNWRIRPDDMVGWGTLEFSVSPTSNSSTDWPDAATDVALCLKPDKNVLIPNGRLGVGLNGTPSATFEVVDSTGGDYSHTKQGWARKRTFSVPIINNQTRYYPLVNYQAGNMLVGRLEIYTARGGGFNQTKGFNEWRVSWGGHFSSGTGTIYGTAVENTSFQSGTGNSVDLVKGYNGGTNENIYIKVPGSVYGGRVYFIFEGIYANWQWDEGTYQTSAP